MHFTVSVITISTSPSSSLPHTTPTITTTPGTYSNTQGEATAGDSDSYLTAVKRMHAKQDAWGRAARSASGSGSASESPNGSQSRSPPKLRDGGYSSMGMLGGIGESSGSADSQHKKGRKKVAKACLACQKSHVTCDDSECEIYTA